MIELFTAHAPELMFGSLLIFLLTVFPVAFALAACGLLFVFIGVEIVADRATRSPDASLTTRIVNGLRERRVLISASGPRGNVLKIRPPLVFSRTHAALFLEAFAAVLDELSPQRI